MIKNTELKRKNISENVKKLVAVYIYIVYCNLENKIRKLNNKYKDRTILKINNTV